MPMGIRARRPQENKAIARQFVEEMMNGQLGDRIEEFVAADAVHHERTGGRDYREAIHSV
jgi:hypothetical protein